MPSNKDIEIRSEQVQEILNAIPNWMIRWGNTIIILLIVMLLFISWFIKYPDIISTEAVITSKITSEKIFAKSEGKITHFLINDKINIKKNTPIAVIENTANYRDVLFLKSIVDTIKIKKNTFFFPIRKLPSMFLGELESNYILFKNSYLRYLSNKKLYSEKENLLKSVIKSFKNLSKQLKEWDRKFILRSPIDGEISYFNNKNTNQTFQKGDLIFIIIPSKTENFFAKLKLPAKNLGKIKKGQLVYIKLENYPSEEFGVLNGVVSYISPILDKDGMYLIDVTLCNKLITSLNKKINIMHGMIGIADIITKDLRLINRFFSQTNSNFNK